MKNLIKFLLFFIIIQVLNNLNSTPKQIIILRHAEKIRNPSILTEQYSKLSKKGIERANSLAKFFSGKKINFLKGKIDAIFAVTPRTLQTIAPTARILKKPIQNYFSLGETETKIANELAAKEIMSEKYNDKVIVICWTHGNIPVLAKLLGLKKPPKWGKNIFNRFWILNYQNENIEFEDIEQNL